MTREKFTLLTRRIIKKYCPDLDETVVAGISAKLADTIETAQELEAMEQEGEPQLIDFDQVRDAAPELPRSPGVAGPVQEQHQPPRVPLVVTPDSKEGREALKGAPNPVRAIRPQAPAEGNKWNVDRLQEVLYRHMPEEIRFLVEVDDERGYRQVPIKLKRNIIMEPGAAGGFDGVRVTYKDPRTTDDSLTATTVIWTDDPFDPKATIEKVTEQAKALWRPRPRVLQSATPTKQGTFTPAIPTGDGQMKFAMPTGGPATGESVGRDEAIPANPNLNLPRRQEGV